MEKEISRMMNILRELDPRTEEYTIVLNNLDHMYGLKREVDRWGGNEQPIYLEEQVSQSLESVAEPEPVKIKEPAPAEEKTTEVQYEYTKEYVRDLLLKARNNGVKVEPIIEAFTPEGKPAKFSSIPASKYSELVKEINKNA